MHMLQRPVVIHQLASQPVEQFRMSRCDTGFAEIAGSRHQSLSEVELPQSIHDHSRRERVVFGCHPLSQRQSALLFRRGFGNCQFAERRDGAGCDLFALGQRFAAE